MKFDTGNKSEALTEAGRLQLRQYRRRLLLTALVSAALDAAVFTLEMPQMFMLFGLPLVADELLELILSKLLSGSRIKLTLSDKLIGLLPIPFVTAVTVRCAKDFIGTYINPVKILNRLYPKGELKAL